MRITKPEATNPVGVRTRTAHCKQWDGINVETVEWVCAGQSHFDLTCARFRLGVVLAQSGGTCETRSDVRAVAKYAHRGGQFASLSPPGMQVWACSDDIRYARSVAVSCDEASIAERLGVNVVGEGWTTPRLNFHHERLCTLAEMLAGECAARQPFDDLYAESLIVAMLVEITRLSSAAQGAAHTFKLTPWQLRLAIEYMQARVAARVSLRDLAQVTKLSQSHFSRAFKASTGLSPYRWFLNARLTRAQQLLLRTTSSFAEIAAATGFADQAHFTRVFRRLVGAPPGAWQRDQRS